MRSQLSLAFAAALVAAACLGCTTSEAGNPKTSGEVPPGPVTTSPKQPSSAVDIPPRPKALQLDSVEPCSLFTDAQRGTLDIGRSRSNTDQTQRYRGAKQCMLEVATSGVRHVYRVVAVTTEGIGPWLNENRNVDATLTSVGGYAAARHVISGAGGAKNSGECSVSVDVADGQQLLVSMAATSKDVTQDQICQMSEKAAEMAVTTLQTLG